MDERAGMLWFPNYNDYDVIEVANPLAEEFRFRAGGKEYSVPANGQRPFPAYVANLYVEKMSAELLQQRNQTRLLNDRDQRQLVVDEITVGKIMDFDGMPIKTKEEQYEEIVTQEPEEPAFAGARQEHVFVGEKPKSGKGR